MHVIALLLAIIGGIIVVAGFFLPAVVGVQQILLNWAVILTGTAAVLGIFNLILVHASRIHRKERGGAYSAILLISLFATFTLGLMLGPDREEMRTLVGAVVIPAESSLMGLLAVTLVTGAMRLFRRGFGPMSILFLSTAVLMLVASATLPFGELGILTSFLGPWVQHVLALGGARGILVGVALGTLITGVRVLVGSHRPYESR